MAYVISTIVVMLMVYYYNKKNDTKYNPIVYGVYALLFGAIFGICMFFGKYYKDIGEEKISKGCYIVAGILFAINIIILLCNLCTMLTII